VTDVSVAGTASVAAQAKVNLSLRILAREDGGYHQVETLLCRIDLADSVTVSVGGVERSLHCAGDAMPAGGLGAPEENLAWRAAAAYAEATSVGVGFTIEIDKRIPVGGGLGGGSADAGAVLRCLNALNPHPLAPGELLSLAGSLGADVPFLTQDRSPLALAWGRGDRMVTLPPLPARRVLLFVPADPVATADAYRWVDEAGTSAPASAVDLHGLASWAGVSRLAGNDFEGPVSRRVPRLGAMLEALRQASAEGVLVQMSGSGSTLFAVTSDGPKSSHNVEIGPAIKLIGTSTSAFVEPVVLTH
jgi:4-diphosphocytidyl-2-C-methyl-D-erythritol kinase